MKNERVLNLINSYLLEQFPFIFRAEPFTVMKESIRNGYHLGQLRIHAKLSLRLMSFNEKYVLKIQEDTNYAYQLVAYLKEYLYTSFKCLIVVGYKIHEWEICL